MPTFDAPQTGLGTSVRDDLLNVMVVDDSAVIRGLLSKSLEKDPGIRVAESVANGEVAVRRLGNSKFDIDVIVLDVEMPVMDGITALPLLLETKPTVQIIMASTLTRKNAEISLKALSLGAADYLPKPTSSGSLTRAEDFKRELVEKVKALGAARRAGTRIRHVGPQSEEAQKQEIGRSPTTSISSARPVARTGEKEKTAHSERLQPQGRVLSSGTVPIRKPASEIVLRKNAMVHQPAVLAIGSSTGGPQALFEVLGSLGKINLPIVITQHMPATFTTLLAEHISRVAQLPCAEGVDGEKLEAGRIYLAPGGYHMVFAKEGDDVILHLNQDPPENFCRPSVDPMLRSLVEVYGGKVLASILTGMGNDGLRGSELVTAAGGTVVAQDEQTSVVWGMPGAVASAGLCSSILPLKEIAPHLQRLVKR